MNRIDNTKHTIFCSEFLDWQRLLTSHFKNYHKHWIFQTAYILPYFKIKFEYFGLGRFALIRLAFPILRRSNAFQPDSKKYKIHLT
jgi:hypothetical protein